MTIRQMIQSGIKFEGALRVVRWDNDRDDYEVYYNSDAPEHTLLVDTYEDMLDREILMIYPVMAIKNFDDGETAEIPQIQIEVA